LSRPLASFLAGSAVIGFSYLKEKTDTSYDCGDLEAGALGAGLAIGMGFVLEL